MHFVGRTGNLATIMSLGEDTFVNTLSGSQTGWLGGTIFSNAGVSDNIMYYNGFNATVVTDPVGWYWACGPEIGTRFYSVNSLRTNPNNNPGLAEARNGDSSTDLDLPDAYYNWARVTVSYEPVYDISRKGRTKVM